MILSCTTPAFAENAVTEDNAGTEVEKNITILDEEHTKNTVTENAVADNSILTEPFDVTYEDEVDAGLYPYDESTVLVKLKKKSNSLNAEEIASIEYLFKAKDGFWYTANLSEETTPKTAIEALRNTDDVLIAEYNYLYEAGATTLCDGEGFHEDIHGNPHHRDEWHLDSCGIQHGWQHIKDDHHKNPGGDSGVIVAVIDTGVDYDHEDLKNNMWVNTGEIPGNGIDDDGNGYIDDYYGVDIVARKGNGDDDHGHGTHVAGIIAAANNNVGVVGVAYNAKIMAIKAGQASGNFLQTDICKAINYARENGADVINMSFGGSASTIAVQDALEEAYTSCVLVAAAGNDSAPNEGMFAKPCYPAAYSFVLGVMSVDDYGIESNFTNYDAYGFNDVEYELYAPGNAIKSTIPNDKYAIWNGTSMAAPIVSGMAAVLRSVYSDTDKYPTKFIYGQLASTSDRTAECNGMHGSHNIPKIVNLYDALTKMPKPDVSVSDYATFDSESISNANNGDGTIDSGETIALGFELRNRWGMSEDTVVTIDAISQAGIPNPYVEFSADGKSFGDSASVNYGSVGTYSTQDCGKIIEDGLFTGWENPFYLKISKDAPNETILAITVSVKCKNALDESDCSIYSPDPITLELIIKKGIILPQSIDEDMTLTKDNYYIIQSSTVIEEGATVTVTEGTNIQFWTNDSTDPYADSYMAQLEVKGKLNCIGTEEEHVKIFPSDLFGQYAVLITQTGNGEINFKYTDLTNLESILYKSFNKAENCEFNVNYNTSLLYRRINNGFVITDYINTQKIAGGTVENCAFYKLGTSFKASVSGNFKNCIFVDCAINFGDYLSAINYENCVFLGNNNYSDGKEGETSSLSPYVNFHNCTIVQKIVRDEETGHVYVQIMDPNDSTYSAPYAEIRMIQRLAEYMGGTLAQIETQEEWDFLKTADLYGTLGAVSKDEWLTGEKVGDFLEIEDSDRSVLSIYGNKIKNNTSQVYQDNKWGYTYILEFPGSVHVEELSLERKSLSIDTSVTYQLEPLIYPSLASERELLYFSSNTAVATVDDDGLVTPVGVGTATIYVFSEDMQVSASVKIIVKDEIKAKKIIVPEHLQINIGESATLNAAIKPNGITKIVTYESLDESVATVDTDGVIQAVSVGETTIVVSVSNGDEVVSAQTKVNVVVPTEGIKFDTRVVYLKPGETKSVQPTVTPKKATNKKVIFDTSDEEICYVNEDGEIVGAADGLATLKATVENTELSDSITVCVSEEINQPEIVNAKEYKCGWVYFIDANGSLWKWNRNNYVIPNKITLYCDDTPIQVKDIAHYCDHNIHALIIDTDGNLYKLVENVSIENGIADGSKAVKIAENAEKFMYATSNFNNYSYSCAVVMKDGSAMMLGINYSGMLGIGGSGQYVSKPVTMTMDNGEKIIDAWMADQKCTFFLTESGVLYVAGTYCGEEYEFFEKIFEFEEVTKTSSFLIYTKDYCYYLSDSSGVYKIGSASYDWINQTVWLEDGRLCRKYYNSTPNDRLNLDRAKRVFGGGYMYYIATEKNELYAVTTGFDSDTVADFLPIFPNDSITAPTLRKNDSNLTEITYDESGNITSAVLKESNLVLGFSTFISVAQNKYGVTIQPLILKENGSQIAVKRTCDLNDLIVTIGRGFTEGAEYELTIPANALVNNVGLSNEEITVSFTYLPDEEEVKDEDDEAFMPDGNENESEHVHDFTTETVMPTLEEDGKITNTCECGETNETVLPKLTERKTFTADDYTVKYNEFVEKGYNTNVWHSAILNRLNDSDVTKWLRITASQRLGTFGFGGNWWGTTNEKLINRQIVDYNDFTTLGDINEGEILTEAPEDTFPFVTEAYILDESGEVQSVVSGGKVKFVVKFNRDMDTEYGAKVYFGSTYPYGDYEIDGKFNDARTWIGETTLKTVIENGYQFIKVTSGRTAADENGTHLKLYDDWARFGFEIDTTSAMAMMMQGYADNDGIHLEWQQDDYDTLAGYNVYRATSENGNYVRINKTIIPSDENTYDDTDVEPGKKYYYTFTVVLTDVSSESKSAGKISITAKDTMAPNVYHSPVYTATTGSKVIVSATVSDNVGVQSAKLYYKIKGTDEWKTADMTSSNDKYTASVPSAFVTLDGVEYYIAAFDGVNYTYAGGRTSENPYEITVYAAVENNAKGDVDGDGNITVLDALMLLRAIYDESLLTQEQFLRADINGDGVLSAVEALRILQYANKKISSVLF